MRESKRDFIIQKELTGLLHFPPLPPSFPSSKMNLGDQKDGSLALIGHLEGRVHMLASIYNEKNLHCYVHGLQ